MKICVAAFAIFAAASAIFEAQAAEADLFQQLREQIVPCWNRPKGVALNAAPLIVRAELERDGHLKGDPSIEFSGGRKTPKLVVDSALRAVRACASYHLPADKYAIWKQLHFTFKLNDGM